MNGVADKWKYNGIEHEEALGLDLYEMDWRQYDAAIGRFTGIDALAEDFVDNTPYNFSLNIPTSLSDPTGLSTRVIKNEDGTYTVVGGDADDGDNNIYVVSNTVNDDGTRDFVTDDDGNNVSIGESLTSHSFFDDNGNAVVGATIDLGSTEGQDFIDQLIADNPDLAEYLSEALGDGDYNFKDRGIDRNGNVAEQLAHRHRGSVASNGQIGSARDFGNGAAGLVAGRKGIPYFIARIAFDAQESRQNPPYITAVKGYRGGIAVPRVTPESTTTVLAEKLGYGVGNNLFQQAIREDVIRNGVD